MIKGRALYGARPLLSVCKIYEAVPLLPAPARAAFRCSDPRRATPPRHLARHGIL